ncbi:hypothetical protein [Empedobacter stercoris]|uniref:hypothetical protein n=1 Tax=Empedobacter stercoris TaxID=1628248 RepID=UPI0039E9EB2C
MKDYKKKIIELLNKGYSLNEISEYLKENDFQTNSLSSVEKYVFQLKKQYKAKTMFQLAYLIYK